MRDLTTRDFKLKGRRWSSWAWLTGKTPEQQLARARRRANADAIKPRLINTRRSDRKSRALRAEVAALEAEQAPPAPQPCERRPRRRGATN